MTLRTRRDISHGRSRASFPRYRYDGEANDANAGGRGADAAAEGCGAGDQTHRSADGLLKEYRAPLPAWWRLGRVQDAATNRRVARARAVAGGTIAATSGQRGCGPPGSTTRARRHGVAAYGGASSGAISPRTACR